MSNVCTPALQSAPPEQFRVQGRIDIVTKYRHYGCECAMAAIATSLALWGLGQGPGLLL